MVKNRSPSIDTVRRFDMRYVQLRYKQYYEAGCVGTVLLPRQDGREAGTVSCSKNMQLRWYLMYKR